MLFIITQTIALLCTTYTAFTKSQRRLFVVNLLFNIFAGLTALIQSDYSSVVSYAIIIYRSALLLYKTELCPKHKLLALTFIIPHIIFGIVTWKDIWSLVPMLAPILAGCIMWFSDNLKVYRFGGVINHFVWLLHNMSSGAYILALARIYGIMVYSMSLIKTRKE